jgi:integrase
MNQISFEFTVSMTVHSVADLMRLIEAMSIKPTETRDLISALRRTCEMSAKDPAYVKASPPVLRDLLEAINPAAHGITPKTLTNNRSLVSKALEHGGFVDNVRGRGELAKRAQADRKTAAGLATFMGFCSLHNIAPSAVTDETVQSYLTWLINRTVLHDPQDLARQVPTLWERLRTWHPEDDLQALQKVSFAKPRKTSWDDLASEFRADAEAYLKMREDPDLEDEDAPVRPLAKSTLRQIRAYLRLSYAAVVDSGGATPLCLGDLVKPESLKAIIVGYRKSDGTTSAFLGSLIQCLMAVAELHVKLKPGEIADLKKKTKRYRHSPVGLTQKNKTLLRQFDDETLCAKLFRLPDQLMREGRELMAHDLATAARQFQAGLAIGILLNAPMRSQNLIALDLGRHIQFDRGKAKARILIPAVETKSKRMDLFFELSEQLSEALCWYQNNMLPALEANSHGRVFVQPEGDARSQSNLANLIKSAVRDGLGIHMTPHQFRHLAAKLYLDAHPEDFETVRGVLGHSFTKTTMTYAGLSTERSSKVYGKFIVDESAKLGRRRQHAKTVSAKAKPTKATKPKPLDDKHAEAKPTTDEPAEAKPEKGEQDE